MNRHTLPITFSILATLLTSYFLYFQPSFEGVNTLLNNIAISHPPLITLQPGSILQPTPTPTRQLTSTIPISSNTEPPFEPDIPSVIKQVHLGSQVVDALADPATDHLYVMMASGELKILELADGKEVTHFETGFQATNDYFYSGLLLSLDPNIGRPVPSPTFTDDKLVFISLNGNVYRSTDGGDSWVDIGILSNLVAFSPNFTQDKLIIGTNKSRSIDGGQTWQPLDNEPDNSYFQDIFFAPEFEHNQTVYMLLQPQQVNSKMSFYRSTDAGHSWQLLISELPADFDYTHSIILSSGDLYVSAKDGRDLTLDLESLTWGSTEK
jgi:hypothetical protein